MPVGISITLLSARDPFPIPVIYYLWFHLQIRYHTADKRVIASDEIASATHLRKRYHTADKRDYR